jgi:hypothetical protein
VAEGEVLEELEEVTVKTINIGMIVFPNHYHGLLFVLDSCDKPEPICLLSRTSWSPIPCRNPAGMVGSDQFDNYSSNRSCIGGRCTTASECATNSRRRCDVEARCWRRRKLSFIRKFTR